MKIILEKSLDFRQFQNLCILTVIAVVVLLGVLDFENFMSFGVPDFGFVLLSLMFIAILLTKKGLYAENQKLYVGVFLLGFLLRKTLVATGEFQCITLVQGKLSTNYNYSDNIRDFHNWEPDLNYSVDSFTILMVNDHKTRVEKILTLTKLEKAKAAMEFIIKNSNLKY